MSLGGALKQHSGLRWCSGTYPTWYRSRLDPIRWIWKGWSTWHRINCETGNPAIPNNNGWDYVLYPKNLLEMEMSSRKYLLRIHLKTINLIPFQGTKSASRESKQCYTRRSLILSGRKGWNDPPKKPHGKWKASAPSLTTNDLPGSYCCRSVKQAKRFTKQNFVVSVCVCAWVCVCVLPIKHSILMQPDYNCKNKPGSCGSQSGLVIRHNNMQRIGDCFWMLGPKCGKADMSCYEQAKLKVSSESLSPLHIIAINVI